MDEPKPCGTGHCATGDCRTAAMPPDPHEIRTEWSLVLDGDPIDSTLGHHHEMNGLDEATARRRLQTWTAYRPEVKTTLRRRIRVTHVGEWSEAS